ncbi:hypothetical protein [Micromonospora sp. LH3U1]|uniref:hypothetical protein n=1 Tax=Micromonospora sp. LH3U1 TaxID=3018339 RepID=UPI00234ACF01|nr:hypothetical protein [Micromonospora sp. LH3U1]WCN80853.1 hypothetical protein PCA76_28840 [Micromonospora sp. LH3U1]
MSVTGIRKVLAAVFVGLALTLFATAPAAAQADKLKLTVAGDGAEGVTIQATYTDGRRLDQLVRLVMTATGPDGQRVGPVQLEPAPEGQGFYTSGPLLTAGSWRVKVNSPAPLQSEATATVQARAAQSPPVPAPVAVTADGTAGRGAGAGWWPFAAAGLVLVAAAMGVAMLFGRRRPGTPND